MLVAPGFLAVFSPLAIDDVIRPIGSTTSVLSQPGMMKTGSQPRPESASQAISLLSHLAILKTGNFATSSASSRLDLIKITYPSLSRRGTLMLPQFSESGLSLPSDPPLPP